MIDIGLAAVANQSLSVQLGERNYVIDFHEANGVMCVTLTRDGVVLVSGSRVTGGTPLLPYRYLESGEGNFLVTVDNEEIPYWDQFGNTQFLVYLSAEELAVFRG
jgi:hypothetical protein